VELQVKNLFYEDGIVDEIALLLQSAQLNQLVISSVNQLLIFGKDGCNKK